MKAAAYVLNLFLLTYGLYFLFTFPNIPSLDFEEWVHIVLWITCPIMSIVYIIFFSEPILLAKKRAELHKAGNGQRVASKTAANRSYREVINQLVQESKNTEITW